MNAHLYIQMNKEVDPPQIKDLSQFSQTAHQTIAREGFQSIELQQDYDYYQDPDPQQVVHVVHISNNQSMPVNVNAQQQVHEQVQQQREFNSEISTYDNSNSVQYYIQRDPEVSLRRNRLWCSVFLEILFAGLILSMALGNRKSTLQCTTPIFSWMIVFAGIQLCRVLKDALAATLLQSRDNAQRQEAQIDMIFCMSVLNFEFAWLIYGNTFHYSSAGLACMDSSSGARSLWVLMQVILIYSYFLFALYLFFIGGGLYMLYSSMTHRPQSPMVERVPYLSALNNIKKERFDRAQQRMGSALDLQCSICLQEYVQSDELAELNCDERHCFHSKCLEDWLRRKLECPLCKRPVNQSSPVQRVRDS